MLPSEVTNKLSDQNLKISQESCLIIYNEALISRITLSKILKYSFHSPLEVTNKLSNQNVNLVRKLPNHTQQCIDFKNAPNLDKTH